jgi:DNA-3-methyladenine glycosylase
MAQEVDTFPTFLDDDATMVAPKLLGCYLVRDFGSHQAKVMIVETESYDQSDAASHSFNGQTPRTDVMFGESGHLYVYFTYGMHYCGNIVTGKVGEGSGVLIRGVMPLEGTAYLESRRGVTGYDATNGPAKWCQALSVDKELNGHNLRYAPLRLTYGEIIPHDQIVTTPRIGISKARDAMRRFYINGNPYVSGLRKKQLIEKSTS